MTVPIKYYDVIILGAGAAGLMCAMTAGQRGRSVLVLDISNKAGKKILMSGGGRCNFTNLDIEADNFVSANPHFCKSALKQYTQWDFISLVNKHEIEFEERKHQQLFCKHSAKDIVKLLLQECAEAGCTVQINTNTTSVESLANEPARYRVLAEHGNALQQYDCQSLVVATGGLSIPTLGGATGLGYRLAEQFDLTILPRLAGLVPMTLSGQLLDLSQSVSGVSVPVVVSVPSKSFTEDMLFTHRGISGPCVLQLSNYWQLGEAIQLDLQPMQTLEELTDQLYQAKLDKPNSQLRSILTGLLPKSLAYALEDLWAPNKAGRPLHEYSNKELKEIAEQLKSWAFKPSGTEGYRTAEVTLGGVSTQHLSSKTMEVNSQSGLFFIGEVVDVTGQLGGYNFQWAWSSGYVAGLHV